VTPEPTGKIGQINKRGLEFVVQKHRARRLHYDFRLEHDGVMLSWAVPKGPALDPSVKRLAMETEDHPVEYNQFEGVIPEGEYGAGTVMIWDRGTWEAQVEDVERALAKGDLKFRLKGKKLSGSWVLVRTRPRQWLLIKHRDEHASERDLQQRGFAAAQRTDQRGIETRALAFELGPMFAPFGRIYEQDVVKGLMAIPALAGLKHSSLDRTIEWQRLDLRDAERPEFRIYTGNDLAIDMVCFGSDYLLGLASFDPTAFAQRDAWWEQGDERFFGLNDALQAVGTVAFREPVPAYKDSAVTYLRLSGRLSDNTHPHPSCPRRPSWERELLEPLAAHIATLVHP
jgi:DNA ligase D-like protein (predicted 3'-phosphoesterase)